MHDHAVTVYNTLVEGKAHIKKIVFSFSNNYPSNNSNKASLNYFNFLVEQTIDKYSNSNTSSPNRPLVKKEDGKSYP